METQLRTRQEIDTEYVGLVTQYGDKLFKLSQLQQDIQESLGLVYKKLQALSQEQASQPAPDPVAEVSAALDETPQETL